MVKNFLGVLILLMVVGCGSRAERLNREYDLVSRQIEALENEKKAMVKLEMSAKEYLRAKNEYEQNRGEFHKLREKNEHDGLPVGPALQENARVEDEIVILEKNHGIVSDQIRELEKKRNGIVHEQVKP